jgi:hypothetical protein
MRHSGRSWLTGSLVALTVIGAVARPAGAQQAPAPSEPPPLVPGGAPPPQSSVASGLQVIATPYLWLAGINAAISTPLARAPTVNASVGAFQLLGDLDAVPFMGAIEISDGPLSLLGDAFHVPVAIGITTRNIFFSGGTASLITNQGTADLLYHVLAQPTQSLDAGIGFRAWAFTAGLTLNGRIARTVSVTQFAEWGDPLIAARYHYDFGNGLGLTAYGDVGGFGVGAHVDWQVIGTIDYALKPWVALRLGYRSVNFDYTTSVGSIGFDVHMKGPIFAATFRF